MRSPARLEGRTEGRSLSDQRLGQPGCSVRNKVVDHRAVITNGTAGKGQAKLTVGHRVIVEAAGLAALAAQSVACTVSWPAVALQMGAKMKGTSTPVLRWRES